VLKHAIGSLAALVLAASLAGCGKSGDQEVAAPSPSADASPQMPEGHPPAHSAPAVELGSIARADKTVAEVFEDRESLGGQKVAVRGKVVKTNEGIMQKHWIHLQDGSGAEGTNDLTVTMPMSGAAPKVGDTVLATGTVTRDKDYGMGYVYPVMLEDAQLTVEAAPAQ
jgi:predicted small lipoprotein YifL